MKNKLVIVEGSDKAGKTTFINEFLKDNPGWIYFHNPTGNDSFSHDLYDLIKRTNNEKIKNKLILASHIHNINCVNELLQQNNVVIMDRSLVSAFIYNFSHHFNYSGLEFTSYLRHEGVPSFEKVPTYYFQLSISKNDFLKELEKEDDEMELYFKHKMEQIHQDYEVLGIDLAKQLFRPTVTMTFDYYNNPNEVQIASNVVNGNY